MTRFAAYDDFSIYALGDTPEAAIAKARSDANDPTAFFKTDRISDDLAAFIDAEGWNGVLESFDVIDGVIADTTARPAWFAFRAPNAQTLYGYGTADEAAHFADLLIASREVDLYAAHRVNHQEATELRLEENTEAFNIADEIAAREEEL